MGEDDVLRVVSHVHGYIVGGGIPSRLAGHVVVDSAAVDLHVFKYDVLYLTLVVISVDDRHVRRFPSVTYISERDALHASSRGSAVFLVVAHLHLSDTSLVDILYADIVEEDVSHEVVVAAIDGETSLVIHLRFTLAEDVDVFIDEVFYRVTTFGVTM